MATPFTVAIDPSVSALLPTGSLGFLRLSAPSHAPTRAGREEQLPWMASARNSHYRIMGESAILGRLLAPARHSIIADDAGNTQAIVAEYAFTSF